MNKSKIISTGVGTPGHTLVNTFYIINQNVDVTGAFLLPPSLSLSVLSRWRKPVRIR